MTFVDRHSLTNLPLARKLGVTIALLLGLGLFFAVWIVSVQLTAWSTETSILLHWGHRLDDLHVAQPAVFWTLFATHAAPWPKAIPVGPFPTVVAPTCFPVVGSMRTTLRSARWLAHSVPAPKASPVAATWSVLVGVPLSGSILVIVPSPVFATQTEPAA